MKVVRDTSVLVAAARSNRGASYALVSSIPSAEFQPCLSVSLYMEWQQVLTRDENLSPGRTVADTLDYLRYLASSRIYKRFIFCGGLFCRMQMMTWFWNWHSPPVAATLSRIT